MILRIELPVVVKDEHEEEAERFRELGLKEPELSDEVKLECEIRVFYEISWVAQDEKYDNCSLVCSGGCIYRIYKKIDDLDTEICFQLGIEKIEEEVKN